ncbi:MAG TPA: TrbC/VirB2 family protein [Dyadobacter sp.]|jgi:hypothetical protein|nr:TrbC/VirB2 family protein [Dyadobacter sp.]
MKSNSKLLISLLCAAAVIAVPDIALAAGLQKATSFFDTLAVWLRAIGISVVTLALMWSGYKFLFQQARFQDISHVIFGSLLIGAATEIGVFLLA